MTVYFPIITGKNNYMYVQFQWLQSYLLWNERKKDTACFMWQCISFIGSILQSDPKSERTKAKTITLSILITLSRHQLINSQWKLGYFPKIVDVFLWVLLWNCKLYFVIKILLRENDQKWMFAFIHYLTLNEIWFQGFTYAKTKQKSWILHMMIFCFKVNNTDFCFSLWELSVTLT